MSQNKYRDFVDEMFWLVHEEAPRYEVSLQIIDRLPDGDVVHGP